MQTIVIRLVPAKLKNPDLDLRYVVPDKIEKVTKGGIADNGFDYLPDNSMGIWMQTENAQQSYPLIVKLFKKKKFLKNDLSKAAEIYISEDDCAELDSCTRVYPEE